MGANNKVGPSPLWVDKFGLSDRFRAAVIWSRGNESLRVLVVEDEIRLADNIATAFRDGPWFAVDICHDGEKPCKATEYNLIVLDLMIPKINGVDVLRTVRDRDSVTPS